MYAARATPHPTSVAIRNLIIGEERGKQKSYRRLRCSRYLNCCLIVSFDSPFCLAPKWIGTSQTASARHLVISFQGDLVPQRREPIGAEEGLPGQGEEAGHRVVRVPREGPGEQGGDARVEPPEEAHPSSVLPPGA